MGAPPDPITLREVYAARRRIAGRVRRTALAGSPSLTARAGAPVHLKLEHHQITGSFKLRGASNALACLGETERTRGVVGVSTGNHGRGLAQACREAGVRCVICMSALVPANKVAAIEALGAEVRIVGRSQDDAQLEVERLVAGEGMTMVPPFDHREVIAGQGTLGLELLEDLPGLASVIVPVSGGGLIAGIALALKSADPAIRVLGVSMERGAAMYQSQRAGHPVAVEELASLADALGGGIGLENRYTFAMVHALVDELVTVSETEIAAAIRHTYREEQQVVEGAGVVGVAALLAGRLDAPAPCVVLLSGGNIDMELHRRIAAGDQEGADARDPDPR